MSIATVRAQIATLQRAIPGIKKAYSQLPREIPADADCPQFVTFVRQGEHDYELLSDDAVKTDRDYLMWLLVQPPALGISGEAEGAVEPWITTVLQYFAARPGLGGLLGVEDARIIRDTGPKQLGSPALFGEGKVYWGVEFTLRVTEYWVRTFANGE